MILVFLGPPGCGKGTQADLCASFFSLLHISTGQILRDEIEKKTSLGNEIDNLCRLGSLVPDSIVTNLLEEKIASSQGNGFIFDGFPRTLNQVSLLSSILEKKGRLITKVFSFFLDDSIILKRILGRFVCKSCKAIYNEYFKPTKVRQLCDVCLGKDFEKRLDDSEESLKNRLKTYYSEIKPVKDYYTKKGFLEEVNASFEPDVIFKIIKEKLAVKEGEY